MSKRMQKGKRIISGLMALVLLLGCMPSLTPMAKAATQGGTVTPVAGTTFTAQNDLIYELAAGNYKNWSFVVPTGTFCWIYVNENTTIDNRDGGGSPFVVNGTIEFIMKGSLTVYGQNGIDVPVDVGTGGRPGYAGINVPTGGGISVTGNGTLKAYGGSAGNGGSDAIGGGVTMGGGGGGGAGAGIGGNGGAGGSSPQQEQYGSAGLAGQSAGTVCLYSPSVFAYGGAGGNGGNDVYDGAGGGGYPGAGVGGGGGGGGSGSGGGGGGGFSGGGSHSNAGGVLANGGLNGFGGTCGTTANWGSGGGYRSAGAGTSSTGKAVGGARYGGGGFYNNTGNHAGNGGAGGSIQAVAVVKGNTPTIKNGTAKDGTVVPSRNQTIQGIGGGYGYTEGTIAAYGTIPKRLTNLKVTATPGVRRSISLSWDKVDSDLAAPEYVILRNAPGEDAIQIGVVNTTSYVDTFGLKDNTMYTYHIYVRNPIIRSETTVASATTHGVATAPTGVSVTPTSGVAKSLTVNWAAVNFPVPVTGYNVFRSATADGAKTKMNTSPITGTTFVDNVGLDTNKVYYYTVSAINQIGESAQSTPAASGTTHNIPGGITLKNPVPSSDTTIVVGGALKTC